MKILLIGASGFIGTKLISELLSQNEILNIDKQASPVFNDITRIADVRDKGSLRKVFERADAVVLLAAEHKDDVSPTQLYYDVNVDGMRNVLALMDEFGIKKLVFTSSVAVYGLNKVDPNELTPTDPFNHYGKSKLAAEELVREWQKNKTEKNCVTIIRPTVVFGEGNRGNVYNLLQQIVSGKFLMIGSGRNKKSMSYVGNIVAFIEMTLDSNHSGIEIYNYADKPDLTTEELVNTICKSIGKPAKRTRLPYFIGYFGGLAFDILAFVTGKKFSVSSVRIKKFCATTQFNVDKIQKKGFIPPYSLEQGLINTINSLKQ